MNPILDWVKPLPMALEEELGSVSSDEKNNPKLSAMMVV